MRIGGIASGIDTDSIIRDLMEAERMPLDQMFQRQQRMEWQRDAYREINLALGSFRNEAFDMRLQSSYSAYQVHSSDSSVVTGRANSDATPGEYYVQVDQLAEVAQVHSGAAITDDAGNQVQGSTRIIDALAEGQQLPQTFTIKTAVGEAEIEIEAEDTFAGLARKLSNAVHQVTDEEGNVIEERSLGIRANFDNTTGRFFISSRESGQEQSITFADNEDHFVRDFILNGAGEYDDVEGGYHFTGQDAMFTYYQGAPSAVNEGIQITSATNEVTVNQIGLTLHDTSTEPQRLTVESNPDEVFDQIKGFVDRYNELIDELREKINEPYYRDYPPLTDEQRGAITEREAELWDERAQSGLLRNDSILRSVLDNMRVSFSNPVEGIPGGQIRQLSEIGITTTSNWRDGGRLEIDEEQLRAMIEERPDEVMRLFTNDAEEGTEGAERAGQLGLARRIHDQLGQSINQLRDRAGSPGMSDGADQSTMGRQLRQVNDQMDRFEQRMQQVEERYWRQFTAMERAMAEMNEQSNFLMMNLMGSMGGMR